jgi:hypothetical protein
MDLIAAYLLQRRPLLSLLLQGIGLAGVALLGSMLAPGFYWLVAAQMLLGFGLGITRVACLMVIVTGSPRAVQGRANNLLEFSAIAGLTLSPTISGLAASLLHWRAAFALATVFVAGAFGWVLYTRQSLAEAVGASTGRHNLDMPTAARPAQRPESPAATAVHTRVVGIAYMAAFVLSFIWSGFIATALPLFGGEVVGISTSTREVHHQYVEITPLRILQELLHGAHDHRATPNHRGILFQEKSQGLHFDPMIEKGQNTIGSRDLWSVMYPHHQRNTWPINISIQQSRTQACHTQGHGKVGRYGTLTHAPLTTGHGNNILHPWERRHMRGRLGLCLALCWPLLFETYVHLHCPNTREGAECLLGSLLHFHGHIRLVGGHLHDNVNILPVDLHAFDEPEGDDISRITWIFYRF